MYVISMLSSGILSSSFLLTIKLLYLLESPTVLFLQGCSDSQLVALDHDFHVYGIVSSVAFAVDIPENVSGSFFRGGAVH